MSLMSSTCFQLGPSTAPGMAHCPLATARAPKKRNGGKRLSRAQPSMLELRELRPHSVIQPAFIHSLVYSFDKVIQQIHSFTSHLFLPKSSCLEENPSRWQQKSFFNKVIHSFIYSACLPVSPSPNSNTQADTDSQEDSREDPRADCRSTWSWRVLLSPEPAMSQPHLGNCWGVSSPSSFFSHPASRKSGFRQPGLPAISQPRF